MALSSAFHTFYCHSPATQVRCLQGDQAGILIALLGTYFRAITTIFRCSSANVTFHMAIISVLFSAVFYRKYWRKQGMEVSAKDILIFLALGIYALIPFIHWLSLHDNFGGNIITREMVFWLLFPYIVGSLGVLFYVSRVPERLAPTGCCDILGASHQIWHVCIFIGMAAWYHTLSCGTGHSYYLSCHID